MTSEIETAPSLRRKPARNPDANAKPAAVGTDRPRWPASAWIALAVLGPLALFVGWRVLTLGMADLWVNADPEGALSWRPNHPEALTGAADDAMSSLDFPKAKTLALKALAVYPMDGRAYRDLAGIADFFGRKQEARRIFLIAQQRSPRDLPTRNKLLESDLKAGNLPAALHQIDMEMRLQPQSAVDLVPILIALSGQAAALRPLSDLLATRPPWRTYFLTALASSNADAVAVDRVFANKGGDDPLPHGRTEADLLVQRQTRDGRWGSAYTTWVGTLSEAERTVLGNLYDGGFIFQPSGRGFAWQLPDKGTGFDMLIAPRTASTTNNVLQVKFDGLPVDYQPLQQQLILGPGHYRLAGMGQSNAFTSDDGLHWTVSCIGGKQPVLGKSTQFRGDIPWGSFHMEFDVPDDGCTSQWLRLDLGPVTFKGQLLEGSVIFDDLSITRLGNSIPPPAPVEQSKAVQQAIKQARSASTPKTTPKTNRKTTPKLH